VENLFITKIIPHKEHILGEMRFKNEDFSKYEKCFISLSIENQNNHGK